MPQPDHFSALWTSRRFLLGHHRFYLALSFEKVRSGYSTVYVQLFSLVGFTIFILATGVPSVKFLESGSESVILVVIAGVLNVFGLMHSTGLSR